MNFYEFRGPCERARTWNAIVERDGDGDRDARERGTQPATQRRYVPPINRANRNGR